MAHNGGRYQTQLGLPSFSGQWPFMNKIKMARYWDLAGGGGGRPAASVINVNGYPTTATNNPRMTFDEEGGTFQSGKRVLVWEGATTFTCSGATVDTGSSLTGSAGTNRAVMNLSNLNSPKEIQLTIQSTDGNLNNMRWLHENDEASYNAQKLADPNKEPLNPKFLEIVEPMNIGVFRFLDAQLGNASNICKAAHRTPIDHFSYSASQFPPSVYATLTSGASSTMTATQTGFALADGAVVILDLPAALVLTSPTLNVASTGAKAIKYPDGTAFAKAVTGTARRGTFTYVSVLDAWIGTAVYDTGGRDFDEGIMAGWPWEVMLDLCNVLNCHGHFVPPFLTCDTPSDWLSSFATMAASTLNPGLKFRIEVIPNELWNGKFWGTKHAEQCALARWGAASQDDWSGRSASLNCATLESVFSGDRTKYDPLVGFQVVGSPDNVAGTNTSRRFESTRHVSLDGGIAAKTYAPLVCINNYWGTMKQFASLVGTTNEKLLRMVAYIAAARAWKVGDAATKQALIDAQFTEDAVLDWINDSTGLQARLDRWKAVADNYGVAVTFYEGGNYAGDIDFDPIQGIDGVTLSPGAGQNTVIMINLVNGVKAHAFETGMTCRFRGIGGTTSLNSGTYTVQSVTDTTVTIDADTSASGAFTSGGAGTFSYQGSQTNGIIYDEYGTTGDQVLSDFQNASKASPYILYATQHVLQRAEAAGEYPSHFQLSGYSTEKLSLNQWSLYDYLYSTPSPQKDAMDLFNNRLRRKRLTATT